MRRIFSILALLVAPLATAQAGIDESINAATANENATEKPT